MFSSNTTQVSDGGYQISRSLRFNSADSAYLNRTPASAGNKQTWTLSVWVKRAGLSAFMPIYSAGPVSPRAWILLNSSDKLDYRGVDSTNTEVIRLTTTQVFRDPSAWYHIVVAQDTTQATSSSRVKIYVNGTQITAFDTATYPSQNASNLAINDALEQNYGRYVNSPSDGYLSAYLTETNFIDGQALTPSSFGETNAQTGVWQPKAYSGSYGTNGFYLNFSDNSNTTAATLGKDYSGNGNNWTPNNFSVTAGAGNDSLVDSPTSYGTDTGVGGTVRGNYSTMNPLSNAGTLTNGNLDFVTNSGPNSRSTFATLGVSSGKWYWEMTVTTTAGTYYPGLGINTNTAALPDVQSGDTASGYVYLTTGQKYNNASLSGYGATFAANDVIGVALDMDAGTITFYKNNTSQGQAFSGISGTAVPVVVGNNSAAGTMNFGQRPFSYTAPSGFKALCTQNLPTPTIGATTATQAGKYFNPVLYTGNGTGQSITGVGFQPDLVWVKGRSGSTDHALYDAVRGVQKQLETNNTDAETTEITGLTAFGSDGFTTGVLAQLNTITATYVAWNWKANGSGSTNTAGSITSTVSANTTSGFSVVTLTTQASGTATVGHGLGVAPSMYIFKTRVLGESWYTYHTALGASNFITLNGTGGSTSGPNVWNSTAPTSTVFSLGSSWAGSYTAVVYCFAPVAGYSAFGSYTGNGSADGPFVFTGFRPAYVMVKVTTAANVWLILDATRNTSNVVTLNLNADQSSAENTYSGWCDFTSNGFKVRGTDGAINTGSGTYIYMAFASAPLKFSLAR